MWTRLSVFSYGVFNCDLHFDECREALQESAPCLMRGIEAF